MSTQTQTQTQLIIVATKIFIVVVCTDSLVPNWVKDAFGQKSLFFCHMMYFKTLLRLKSEDMGFGINMEGQFTLGKWTLFSFWRGFISMDWNPQCNCAMMKSIIRWLHNDSIVFSCWSCCQACNHDNVIAVRTKLRVQSGWTGVRPFGGQIGPVVTCSLQSQLTWLLPAASPACQLPVDSIFSEPLGRLLGWPRHPRRPQRCPSVILTGGWHLLVWLSWMPGLFDTCVWII